MSVSLAYIKVTKEPGAYLERIPRRLYNITHLQDPNTGHKCVDTGTQTRSTYNPTETCTEQFICIIDSGVYRVSICVTGSA